MHEKLAALGADGPHRADACSAASTARARRLFLDAVAAGASLAEGLQRARPRARATADPEGHAVPARRRLDSVRFVRPAHGLVALHGDDVVRSARSASRPGGRRTAIASKAPRADRPARRPSYEVQLREEGAVIASFAERRAEILRQLQAAAARPARAGRRRRAARRSHRAGRAAERADLPLRRGVPRRAAGVPGPDDEGEPEVLPAARRRRQAHRSLPRRQQHRARRPGAHRRGQRARRPAAPGRRQVLLRPGPQAARSSRACPGSTGSSITASSAARAIASGACARSRAWVAERIGADAAHADRAALLAKADLLTDMVGEFPELQGIMGGYYAAHDGEPAERRGRDPRPVRQPARRTDAAPTTSSARRSLIADRVETLVGIWGIGLKPTGDKDPYALRRHALTLIDSFQRVGGSASVAPARPARAARRGGVDLRRAARRRHRRRGRVVRLRALLPAARDAATTRAPSTR